MARTVRSDRMGTFHTFGAGILYIVEDLRRRKRVERAEGRCRPRALPAVRSRRGLSQPRRGACQIH
eukprot:6198084-Pleurochrysis_carterae.AAC.9